MSKAKRLPTLPTVAVKLLTVMSDPDVELHEISSLIRLDPSLAGKVIRAANSAQYGVGRIISDVDRAVILLGKRTTSMLALTFSLSDVVMQGGRLATCYRRYWVESVVQAITAESLARASDSDQLSQYFCAGLLQDLGRLYLLQEHSNVYAGILQSSLAGPLVDLEQEAFEVSHAQLSAEMLSEWQFPDHVVAAVAEHHRPIDSAGEPPSLLTQALRIAALMSDYFGRSNRGLVRLTLEEALARFPAAALTAEELTVDVYSRIDGMSELFRIEPGSLPSIHEMLTDAMHQIAVLAMSQSDAASAETVELMRENDWLWQRLEAAVQRIHIDGLTGLYTRDYLLNRLEQQVEAAAKRGGAVGLLFIDLDHFKQVNDTYGHPAGDHVLQEVARTIATGLRGQDLAARYGGEEFAILIGEPDWQTMLSVANRVRQSIESLKISTGGRDIAVTASVGAAFMDFVTETKGLADCLVDVADKAMYQSKSEGRNRVVVATRTESRPHQEGRPAESLSRLANTIAVNHADLDGWQFIVDRKDLLMAVPAGDA